MAPLIRHAADHGVPIALPQVMDEEDRYMTIRCGTHAYASKKVSFIHVELADQVQAGYVAVLHFEAVIALHNLWL